MSVFGNLLKDAELLGKDGAKVKASELDAKDVVGLYFSAHWCPPCRGFTPKLAETYKAVKAAGKNFEVVFISSDKSQEAFDEYFAEQPWLALPFDNKEVDQAVSRKFGIEGLPTLVLLDGKGNLLNKDGRGVISEDPAGKGFPWIPPTLQEALGETFVKGDSKITAESLKGKTIGLYFSAHWCGPCRGFTPKLVETYKKVVAAGKDFEIIFISSDQDQKSFDEYRAEMPWAALPFSDRAAKKALSSRFGVQGIPSLVFLDGIDTGNTINDSGRSAIMQDPEGENFPWHPASLNDLTSGADGINENLSVIALLDGADESSVEPSIVAIRAVADKRYAAARAASQMHAEQRFFFAKSDSGVAKRVRELTKTSGPTLILLDIPDNGGFYSQPIEGALTTEAIEAMLTAYQAKTLSRQQLS